MCVQKWVAGEGRAQCEPFFDVSCLFLYCRLFSSPHNMMSWIKNNVTAFWVMDFMFIRDPSFFWYFIYTWLFCSGIKQKSASALSFGSCLWIFEIEKSFDVKLKGIFDRQSFYGRWKCDIEVFWACFWRFIDMKTNINFDGIVKGSEGEAWSKVWIRFIQNFRLNVERSTLYGFSGNR